MNSKSVIRTSTYNYTKARFLAEQICRQEGICIISWIDPKTNTLKREEVVKK